MDKLKYAERVASGLESLLTASPQPEAEMKSISAWMQDEGLLIADPPMNSPAAFARAVIVDSPMVYENSGLDQLWQRNWNPADAENPRDLISNLLLGTLD